VIALPPFYPIVDSADWVGRLAPLGIELVQLRLKAQPADVIRREVHVALAVCRWQGVQLVVNDHWRIALDEGADFIHLGQQDLLEADLKAIRGHHMRLGISTHDHAELDSTLAASPDYVALGPIYATTRKSMPWAPQGLARIAEWKRLIGERPLVAIGGITLERAAGCFDAGADSIATIGDVTGHADPLARAAAWLTATAAHP